MLLTGATGFVGMEVLAALLETTDRDVVALIRADDDAGATERLHGVLERLGAREHAGRVRAVAGDVTEEGLGLDAGRRDDLAAQTASVIHCAASVSFALPLDESRAINVEGTRRMLDLAGRAPALERFVHVSTAYVAGTHEGSFGEDDTDVGQGFRNAYEQSKLEAEHLVRSRDDLPVSIVRPSIIVGDSRTGWTNAFNVVYVPLQAFANGIATDLPADPDALADIVPIDHVVAGILAALDAPEPGTFALVANDRAIRVGDIAALASRYFDRPPPVLVPPERFDGDAETVDQLEAFFPYFSVKARFDDTSARALGLRVPALPDYFDRLMDFAVGAEWGKRDVSRPRSEPVLLQ